ncbi:MAG: PEP-CTERM sorting domain-containing protein [Gammaproteobacteria bacterium]
MNPRSLAPHPFAQYSLAVSPLFAILAFSTLMFSTARAELINGIDFPQGALSFADEVVNFSPGPGPAAAFLEPLNALGVPDVNTTNGLACFTAPSTANCKFTSLGDSGSLTVRFTDNFLSGSSPSGTKIGTGDGFNDLYIVEVGVAESTSVEISADGSNWFNAGNIGGGGGNSIGVFNYGFDIDKLGFGFTDLFTYVRLVDLQIDPGTSPQGADIDGIGAIQTVVPAPASLPLAITALGALMLRSRRRLNLKAS